MMRWTSGVLILIAGLCATVPAGARKLAYLHTSVIAAAIPGLRQNALATPLTLGLVPVRYALFSRVRFEEFRF